MQNKLSHVINDEFKYFNENLNKRLTNNINTSWLLADNNHHFKPDYLLISTIGKHKGYLYVNYFFSKYLWIIWKTFIWKKIYKTIIFEIKKKYENKIKLLLSKTYLSNNECDSLINHYFKHIEDCFKNAPKQITKATFTEVFTFVSLTLQGFAKINGINNDYFIEEKEKHSNECLLIRNELYPYYKDNLDVLIYLVIRSNWIDIVEDNVSLFIETFKEEVNSILDDKTYIDKYKKNTIFYQVKTFKNFIKSKPKHILYELDNSGEVIFDLELINYILSYDHKITIVAKEVPILNDVTKLDLDKLLESALVRSTLSHFKENNVTVISSGCKSTGKMPNYVSSEYIKAYQNADAQIIKGQGNFQTMPMGIIKHRKFIPNHYKKPIFYLMAIKAPMIEQSLKGILKDTYKLKKELFLYYFNPSIQKTFPFNLNKSHIG